MTIQISNTSKIVYVNGVPARIWEGHTASGIPVHCFITPIAAPKAEDLEQFDKELQHCSVPSADIESYPLHIIL